MPKNNQNIDTAIALERICELNKDVKELHFKINNEYVTFVRYNPVEKIVYTMVSVILVTVLGAGMAFILGKK